MVLDGNKSTAKSKAAWAIIDAKETPLTKDRNPDFRNITTMHSHRAEVFGLLAAFTFLDEYCRFYCLSLKSEVWYYCDNQEVINKLIELREDSKKYDKLIRTIDHEAILASKLIMPLD